MSAPEQRGKPPPPPGLGEAGQAFWRRMQEGLSFDPHELELLTHAAHTVDDIARLDAAITRDGDTTLSAAGAIKVNPCITEVRQLRATLARLITALNVPDADGATRQRRPLRGYYSTHRRIGSA